MSIRPIFAAFLAFCLSACGESETNYAAGDPVPEHQTMQVSSKVLGETRDVAIWLPPGYDDNLVRYPVVYMPDGGLKEDFPHIANTLDKLVREELIAPVILVGVSNTDRGRDMTPASTTDFDKDYAPQTDGAANFRTFWRNELIPAIEAKYRTNGERAIIGESLAGLFIVDSFMREPKVFQRHIAMDPSLWWDNHALVNLSETRLKAMDETPKTLWFASSDAKDIYVHTDALARVLDIAAPESVRWKYVPQPELQHNTIYRATKEQALKWALWPVAEPKETAAEAAPAQ